MTEFSFFGRTYPLTGFKNTHTLHKEEAVSDFDKTNQSTSLDMWRHISYMNKGGKKLLLLLLLLLLL